TQENIRNNNCPLGAARYTREQRRHKREEEVCRVYRRRIQAVVRDQFIQPDGNVPPCISIAVEGRKCERGEHGFGSWNVRCAKWPAIWYDEGGYHTVESSPGS